MDVWVWSVRMRHENEPKLHENVLIAIVRYLPRNLGLFHLYDGFCEERSGSERIVPL